MRPADPTPPFRLNAVLTNRLVPLPHAGVSRPNDDVELTSS